MPDSCAMVINKIMAANGPVIQTGQCHESTRVEWRVSGWEAVVSGASDVAVGPMEDAGDVNRQFKLKKQ